MGKGVSFTGKGGQDASHDVSGTGHPASGNRSSSGPVKFAGDGGMDVGNVNDSTGVKGKAPEGGGVKFAGDVGKD